MGIENAVNDSGESGTVSGSTWPGVNYPMTLIRAGKSNTKIKGTDGYGAGFHSHESILFYLEVLTLGKTGQRPVNTNRPGDR